MGLRGVAARGTVVVSLAVYFGGSAAATAYALFYFWVALAACYFLRPRIAFTHLCIASAAYALVLAREPGSRDAPRAQLGHGHRDPRSSWAS